MKQTKNKSMSKFLGAATAFALLGSFGVSQIPNANDKMVSFADPGVVYSTGKELRVVNFPLSVKMTGEASPVVDIPNATVVNGDLGEEVIVNVYSPYGQTVTVDEKVGFYGSFVANIVGDYTVSYTLVNTASGVTTALKTLKVSVIGETASFSFDANSADVIPATYNATIDKPIVLPEPKVLDAKGNEIENAVVNIVVRKGTDAPLELQTVNGKRQFSIPTSVVSGIYTIRYSYSAGGRELATKTETVTVNRTFSADYELGYNFKSSFPSTAVVGVSTTLPAVQAINKTTNANVQSHYSIKVFKRGAQNVDVTATMLDAENKFTPTEEGNYFVQYTVQDFFGNVAPSINWEISNVTDSQRAVPKIVAPYTVPENGIVDAESIEETLWALPSNGSVNAPIVFPAIYGSDNAIKNAKQLTYSRYLINTTTNEKTVLDSFNPSDENATFNANKKIVLFAPENYTPAADEVVATANVLAGTYTVYYEVKDAKNSASSINYPITISAVAFADSTAPTIGFATALPSSVKPGAVINFALPTATDKNENGTVVDARVRVQTFYEIGTTAKEMADIADILDLETPSLKENNANMFEVSIPNADTAGKKLFVYVVATDDSGNQALTVKVVNIIDIADNVAPTFDEANFDITGSSFEQAQINQDEKVLLPTITFNDNIVTHTNIKAFVYHVETGEVFTVSNQRISRDINNGTISLEQGEFQATLYGDYNITFIATDAGNNITAKSFHINVNKTIASTITLSSLPKEFIDQKMELGTKVEMPVPKVISSNGTEVVNPVYTVTKIAGGNAELDEEKFIPSDVGTYKIAYNVFEDIGGNTVLSDTQTYTIVVSDTKAPTILVNDSLPTVLEKGASIVLPRFTASDSFAAATVSDPNWVAYGVGVKESSLKIEILRNGLVDGAVIRFNDAPEAFNRTFAQNGVYTVRYYAEDLLGQSATKEFSIKVGDVQNPTLLIENAATNKPTTMKLGDKFKVDLTAIEIYDVEDEEVNNENILTKLNVTVTNTSTGETLTNLLRDEEGNVTGFEFEIKKVGTYRVQYSVRDSAYNTETFTHTFTVAEETNDGFIINSDFWTPFLIVASLLVLGGVITTFAVTNKKTTKKIKF